MLRIYCFPACTASQTLTRRPIFFIPGNINAGCKTLKYNITRFCYSFIVFVVKPPSACKLLTHKFCHKSYTLLKIELSCYFNLVPCLEVGFNPREEHSLSRLRKKAPLSDTYMFLGSAGAQKELWHYLSSLAVLWMDFARSPCFVFFLCLFFQCAPKRYHFHFTDRAGELSCVPRLQLLFIGDTKGTFSPREWKENWRGIVFKF